MENIFIDKKFKKYLNSPIVIKGINLQNYQDVKVNCGDKHFSEKPNMLKVRLPTLLFY